MAATTSAHARSRVVRRRRAWDAVPTARARWRVSWPSSSRKSASDIGLRAMFSVQTKSTFIGRVKAPVPRSRAEAAGLDQLAPDPTVRPLQALLEAHPRLPAQDLAEPRVVAVPPPHALGLVQVVRLEDRLVRGPRHDVDELVDADEPILTEVERPTEVGPHQAIDALHTVIDIAIRPCLLAIAPHLDGVAVLRKGHLAADRGGGFLSPPLVRAERAKDVVEPHAARLEAEILGVVTADALREELLPPIAILGVGWIGVFLFQRSHVGRVLEIAGIDAGGRGVEEALHAVHPRGLERMGVDQDVVPTDLGLVAVDEPDAAHVGREGVHLVDAASGDQAVVPPPEVQDLELLSRRRLVLRRLDVDATHAIPALDQKFRQMVPDESPRTRHQNNWAHTFLLSPA